MLLKGDPALFQRFVAEHVHVGRLHRFGQPLAKERRQLGRQRAAGAEVHLGDGGLLRGVPAGENRLHSAPPQGAKLLVVVLERHWIHIAGARENLGRRPQRQMVAPGIEPIGEPGGRLVPQGVESGQRGLLHGLLDSPIAPVAESLGGRTEEVAGFVGCEMHQHVGGALSPFALRQDLACNRSAGEKQSACERPELGYCRQPHRAHGDLFYGDVQYAFQLGRSNERRQDMGVDCARAFPVRSRVFSHNAETSVRLSARTGTTHEVATAFCYIAREWMSHATGIVGGPWQKL
ncbi:MAG: hypothetical protein ABSF98_07560 [Bryobacteraceae bacterium]